jgi:hypothetical protein
MRDPAARRFLMERVTSFRTRVAPMTALLMTIIPLAAWAAGAKAPYRASGLYVEGCSCMGVCPCELTGLESGCQGVGAMRLSSGTYSGTNLAGAKIAYAAVPGTWVRLYVNGKNARQANAAAAFARATFSPMGKIESVRQVPIRITGSGGKYSVAVDNGRVMTFTTAPVIGGDKRTPIAHTNVKNPMVHTFYQGKTLSAAYHDGNRSFDLKGTNSYFNDRVMSSGRI